MAVYKRNYKTYSGPLTPLRSRWLVITRHSIAEVFGSRVSVVLFVVCLVPVLLSALVIYVANSDTARMLLNMRPAMVLIDNRFFFRLLELQGWLALFLTAWVGPAMVSPDLTNGALPLFLSRPVSRAEYVAGKLLVLAIVLSAVTWAPCVLLFGIQAQLAKAWFAPNLFIVGGLLVGSCIWIAVLSLLALAVSAWVRWRIVATGLMVALVVIPAGFGAVVSAVLRTPWGLVLNIPYMVTLVWSNLLRAPMIVRREGLPLSAAWVSLLAVCGLCLMLLNKRIQARQVVRG